MTQKQFKEQQFVEAQTRSIVFSLYPLGNKYLYLTISQKAEQQMVKVALLHDIDIYLLYVTPLMFVQYTEPFVTDLQMQLEQSRMHEAELLGALKEMQDKVLDLEKVTEERAGKGV